MTPLSYSLGEEIKATCYTHPRWFLPAFLPCNQTTLSHLSLSLSLSLEISMTSTKEEAALHDLKQESKFYTKLLSKEKSSLAASTPSFRVLYYGVSSAGSVPFLWESQPGTPKNAISATTPPPLTPPPSYYFAKTSSHKATASKKYFKSSSIITAILPKITLLRSARSANFSLSPSSSSSSSYSGSLSPAGSSVRSHRRRSSFAVANEEPEQLQLSFRGCGVAMVVRSALASVVGHRSSGRRRVTS